MAGFFIPAIGNLLRILIVKIIVALGITWVSYQGYQISLNKLKGYISDAIGSMPSDIANLLLMAGFGQGLGYLFGAFAFVLSMRTLNKLEFVFKK